MDEEGVDPGLLRISLRFIRRVNSWLGYTRATISHLERFSRGWERGRTIWLIDVATGSADVPRAILRWADRQGWDVRIVGVDRHGVTARAATEGKVDPRLSIVQADVMALPFAANSFDYAITSMFLHHLDDEAVVEALAVLGRVARRGVIVSDLIRNRRAAAWAWLFTAAANRMVRHDARVSVAQSFTQEEIMGLSNRAGLAFVKYSRHFGHRFVLSGEK